MLLVDGVEHGSGGWDRAVDEQKDRFLGRKLQPLTDHIHELPTGQVARDQVLLLVDILWLVIVTNEGVSDSCCHRVN